MHAIFRGFSRGCSRTPVTRRSFHADPDAAPAALSASCPSGLRFAYDRRLIPPLSNATHYTQDCKAQTGVESMEKSSAATHVGPVGDEFVGLLGRTDKNGSESQQVFNEVLDQLTAQEDELGMQPSLYTLPSMTFLESLLDEMDSRNASNGMLTEPPMYLPEDSLELPGLELAGAGSTLEDLGLHSPSMLLQKPAYSCPAGAMHRGPSGFSGQGSMGSMGMMPNASVNMPNPFTPAPTAGSAAPSPVKRPPGNQVAEEDDDVLHELNYSYETSKSGRCRKVSSFLVSGNKRKLNMISQHSAPAVVAGGSGRQASVATGVDINPFGPELTEVASTYKKKAQKNRSRSKTTVCLNCGSMDTPQWRVGPLGPRTLCNACGVRYVSIHFHARVSLHLSPTTRCIFLFHQVQEGVASVLLSPPQRDGLPTRGHPASLGRRTTGNEHYHPAPQAYYRHVWLSNRRPRRASPLVCRQSLQHGRCSPAVASRFDFRQVMHT